MLAVGGVVGDGLRDAVHVRAAAGDERGEVAQVRGVRRALRDGGLLRGGDDGGARAGARDGVVARDHASPEIARRVVDARESASRRATRPPHRASPAPRPGVRSGPPTRSTAPSPRRPPRTYSPPPRARPRTTRRGRARVCRARDAARGERYASATLLTGNRRSSAFATLIGGEARGKSPRFRSVSDAREGDSGLIVDGRSRDHRWAFARRKRTSTGSIGPARVPTDDKSVPIGARRTGRAIGENVRFGCTAKHRNALPRASASTDAPSLRRSTREGARRRADVANDAPDA